MTLLTGIWALLVLAFPFAALWLGITWVIEWWKDERNCND